VSSFLESRSADRKQKGAVPMDETKGQLLERIVENPQVMVGKPVIRGSRITVEYVLRMMSQGITIEEILSEYTHLTREDILACLCFAEKTMAKNIFMPLREVV
jgi:uncharacterized protein (DUF433 family)